MEVVLEGWGFSRRVVWKMFIAAVSVCTAVSARPAPHICVRATAP